jgi:hypothetical protein
MAFIKNKKADVSTTILVIGVFIVSALAIISFLLYNQKIQSGFVNTAIFENISAQVENYYFYINSGLSPQQAANNIGAQIQGNQLVIYAEQREEPTIFGSITGSKSPLIISVEYKINLN